MLSKKFSCPVFLENDAVAAALGEALYDTDCPKDFIFIIWGTGIGGSTVSYNEISKTYMLHKLNWFEYFQEWEEKCGGNKIKYYYGKEAFELSEKEWQSVMKQCKIQFEKCIKKTNSQSCVFGGGIAIKQSERVYKMSELFPQVKISVSRLGEDCGLYGSFALIKNNHTFFS